MIQQDGTDCLPLKPVAPLCQPEMNEILQVDGPVGHLPPC